MDKADTLAVAVTLLPIAFVAWWAKSRWLFVAGALGALFGLPFAPDVLVEWEHHATERDRIIANAIFNLEGTLPGGALGLIAGWLICCRDATPPTDDYGRR